MTPFDILAIYALGAVTAESVRYIWHAVARLVRHKRRQRRLRSPEYNHRRFLALTRETRE
jgi:hypothetical protein